jgi:ABC-type antimicrobial peptide transport system permease subunit
MDAASVGGFTTVAQSAAAPTLVPVIRRLLYGMRPQPHVSEVATVADILWSRYRSLYLIAAGLTLAGAVALFLTAIGLFAVLSYAVSLKTGEFGVRLALGARPGSLVGRVVRESLALVGAGTAIGLILAIPMTQLITSELLTTVTPSWQDPVPPAIVCGMLLLTGGLASLVPGWRVARVDPVAALRQE